MSEYIERENVLKKIESDAMWNRSFSVLYEDIEDMPAADVAPVQHGRWIEYGNEADKGFHYCSECKGQAFNYEEGNETIECLTPWCQNCGAKMDGGNDHA